MYIYIYIFKVDIYITLHVVMQPYKTIKMKQSIVLNYFLYYSTFFFSLSSLKGTLIDVFS